MSVIIFLVLSFFYFCKSSVLDKSVGVSTPVPENQTFELGGHFASYRDESCYTLTVSLAFSYITSQYIEDGSDSYGMNVTLLLTHMDGSETSYTFGNLQDISSNFDSCTTDYDTSYGYLSQYENIIFYNVSSINTITTWFNAKNLSDNNGIIFIKDTCTNNVQQWWMNAQCDNELHSSVSTSPTVSPTRSPIPHINIHIKHLGRKYGRQAKILMGVLVPVGFLLIVGVVFAVWKIFFQTKRSGFHNANMESSRNDQSISQDSNV